MTRFPSPVCPLLVLLLMLPAGALAQSGKKTKKKAAPAAGSAFDSVQACTTMRTEMQKVITQSEGLRDILKSPSPDVNTFLTDIFVGTQLMLAFGDEMFRISEQHEETCKAELREKGQVPEILKLYELVAPPTLEAFAFIVRVRATAKKLGDTATEKDMETAVADYTDSLRKLVDLCKSDLGDEAGRCDAIGRSIDDRIQAVTEKPF